MVAFDNIHCPHNPKSKRPMRRMKLSNPFVPDFKIIGILCYCRETYASQMADELSDYFAQSAISDTLSFQNTLGLLVTTFIKVKRLEPSLQCSFRIDVCSTIGAFGCASCIYTKTIEEQCVICHT